MSHSEANFGLQLRRAISIQAEGKDFLRIGLSRRQLQGFVMLLFVPAGLGINKDKRQKQCGPKSQQNIYTLLHFFLLFAGWGREGRRLFSHLICSRTCETDARFLTLPDGAGSRRSPRSPRMRRRPTGTLGLARPQLAPRLRRP